MIILRQKSFAFADYAGKDPLEAELLRSERNLAAARLTRERALELDDFKYRNGRAPSTVDEVKQVQSAIRRSGTRTGLGAARRTDKFLQDIAIGGPKQKASAVAKKVAKNQRLAKEAISEIERNLWKNQPGYVPPTSAPTPTPTPAPATTSTSANRVGKVEKSTAERGSNMASSKGIISKIKANPKTTAGIVAGTALTAAGGAYLYNKAKKRNSQGE